MDMNIKELHDMVQALKATTKTTEKIQILESIPPAVYPWLKLTYNDVDYTFHLTSKLVRKAVQAAQENGWENKTITFYDKLVALSKKGSASREDAGEVAYAISALNPEWHKTCLAVLDRDLKCGISVKTINKAIPDLIPVFPVALGESFKKNVPADLYNGKWFVSRKLDGIRCVVIKIGNEVTCYTRKGHVLKTTEVLEEEVSRLPVDIVLDGELCVIDENGREDYKAITKEYNRKNHTMKDFRFCVFDVLSPEQFYGEEESDGFEMRACDVNGVVECLRTDLEATHVKAVQQEILTSQKQFKHWKERVAPEGWEGLILRKDAPYIGDRSRDVLKVKEFHDAEFVIEDIETGPFTVRRGGKESIIETAVSITVLFKDNLVGVGSGFSLKDREDMLKNPEKYIGNKATIRYFEESEDSDGRPSLRFPVYKGLRVRGD